MLKSNPLVSVITPVFNGEAFVAESIKSVLTQSYSDFELIVVDDGSTDDSCEIVRSYHDNDPRITLISNKNKKGPAGARNTGIRRARGRFIAFLDCDDIWYQSKLSKQLEFMHNNSAALTFTSYDIVAEDGSNTGKRRLAPPSVSYRELTRRNIIGCLTAMVDIQRSGNAVMPNIRMRQDWGLWLRILRETNTKALGIQEPLAALRIRSGSLSQNKLRASYYNFRVLYQFERLPISQALYCVFMHSLGAIRDK